MNKDTFVKVLQDDERVVGALMALYDNQEIDEKAVGATGHVNGIGFNKFDAAFMSSIAKFYLNNGFVTPKQIISCRKNLQKYSAQFDKVNKLKNVRPNKSKTAVACSARVVDDKLIKLRIPYNRELIEEVKSIRGRRAQQDERGWFWTVPLSIQNADRVKDLGITFAESLTEWYDDKNRPFKPKKNFKVKGLKGTPYGFQNVGIQFAIHNKGRALIADDMGLGKTIQAIGFLQQTKEYPAIVVVPASVKLNWHREMENWMDKPKVAILNGRPSEKIDIEVADIYIVNYDILPNKDEISEKIIYGQKKKTRREIDWSGWADHIMEINPKTIICDECHYLKNGKAKRTKAVERITKACSNVIMLSGTPIENKPIEIYQAIKLIDPAMFPVFSEFGKRYCDGHHNGFGWNFNGSSNEQELHRILTNSIMIRRLKENELDLPPKVRSIVPMELTNLREYKRCENDVIDFIKKTKGVKEAGKAANAEALVKFENLKQLAVKGKMKMAIKWVQDFLDNGEKLVLFCTHKKTVEEFKKKFKQAVVIDGSVSQKGRQKAVDTFQNDPKCNLFIGNIKAAGVGITLTAASSTAFLELAWTPGSHDQAEDRVNRIGQESSSINAYYLLADKTIEVEIAQLLDKKRKTIDAIMDGKVTEDSDLISELMRKYGAA